MIHTEIMMFPFLLLKYYSFNELMVIEDTNN